MSLTNAPRFETERLILRGPEMPDAEPFIAFSADKERSEGFGYIPQRDEAWRWFALNIGHWHIHGYGYLTIEDKETGNPAGICGIWNPEGWPEPEIGWVVYEGFEGKGIAYEAAIAVRAWAYAELKFYNAHVKHRSQPTHAPSRLLSVSARRLSGNMKTCRWGSTISIAILHRRRFYDTAP